MVNRAELCEKIHDMYPEIGECDIDLKVVWDDDTNAWAVDFKKDGQPIRHYLEDADAAPCTSGKQCVGLGIEFGQFM